MLDRVREAVFNILGDLTGAVVLDLYAGSGSLGLEALSRGASHATFVERARVVCDLIHKNVADLQAGEHSEVVSCDVDRWSAPGRAFDVIFYDPPYPRLRGEERGRVLEVARGLVASALRPEGVLVFHYPRHELDRAELASIGDLEERGYGTSAVAFLRPAGPEPDAQESSDLENDGDAGS